MHLIQRNPRIYSHLGYQVGVAHCGPYKYNVWRRSEDLSFCSVNSLKEATEVIAEDQAEQVRGIASLKQQGVS